VLAGIFLGIYLITWLGALLFVFIISVYFIIQFIIDHLKHKSTDYLCLVGVILFLVALIIYAPLSYRWHYLVSLVIALFIPVVLFFISRWMTSKGKRPAYYPLALTVLGAVVIAIVYVIPSLFEFVVSRFSIFVPSGVLLTTLEAQPLLFPQGNFTLALAWGNFTTGFFLSFISLGILIYLIIKQGSAEKSLLVVWSLVILAAILGQRRFGYYFAVNVALLTGYLSWQILRLAGFKELGTKTAEISGEAESEKAKPKESRKSGFRITISQVNMTLAVIVILFLVFYPNIGPLPNGQRLAIDTASQARFAPSDAWMSSLSWLKENTPDPFGDPDSYYEFHKPLPPEESYNYPESAYGVMAWWDYGYWITRIAHRLPSANPGQDRVPVTNIARFFTSQDENSAREIIQELEASYIIIDYETAFSKFWAVAIWAGKDRAEFFDIYLAPQENEQLVPVYLFHPDYYRSLSTRLYNFDGKAVTPEISVVISYQEKTDRKGNLYKIITSIDNFDSYGEAEAYVASQESANYKIVSDSPFVSSVPLEALEHYHLIHSSSQVRMSPDGWSLPAVKIFEYID